MASLSLAPMFNTDQRPLIGDEHARRLRRALACGRLARRIFERSKLMRFNHIANRLNPDHFETVVEMLKSKLNFVELRRTERSIWLRQPGTNVDLQFSQSETANRDEDKRRSQVAFLSDTPQADLEALATWVQARGVTASVGAYSDKEFYLDAPDAFVDFVIEAMTPDLADYGVAV
jgi:hypothetical protein